jgi:NAD(P)-dependent dehydrogenase (short-subunit alcohol dehydrogenase family)
MLMARGALVYETGKSAVIGLTRQMAVEFGPKRIRVNAIAPGHIVTENMKKGWDAHGNAEGFRFFELQYPVRRTGMPEDIANAIAFLCSDQASFITGALLPVDGGLSIQLQENILMDLAPYVREHPGMKFPYG